MDQASPSPASGGSEEVGPGLGRDSPGHVSHHPVENHRPKSGLWRLFYTHFGGGSSARGTVLQGRPVEPL